MKIFTTLLLLSALALYTCVRANEFQVVQHPVTRCRIGIFDKAALVFDSVLICATRRIPQAKLRHAAHVVAQWLDQRGKPGVADDRKVLQSLKQNKAMLTLFETEELPDHVLVALFRAGFGIQPTFLREIDPRDGARDATQEEVHHLLQNYGWGVVYPEAFSSTRNSSLKKVWRRAEAKGYYFYDDETCDDACKVTEFLYKAMAVYLGSAIDVQEDEIRIKKRSELVCRLSDFVCLIESSRYAYPNRKWPDGKYKFAAKNIKYL